MYIILVLKLLSTYLLLSVKEHCLSYTILQIQINKINIYIQKITKILFLMAKTVKKITLGVTTIKLLKIKKFINH